MTSPTGSLTFTRAYDPYGTPFATSGSSQTSYGFTSEFSSHGLTYLRARHYAPGTGRFLTRDTWMGDYNRPLSLNQWGYVEGNPVSLIDPTGHCKRADRTWDWFRWPWFGACPSTVPSQPPISPTSTSQPPITSTSTPSYTPTPIVRYNPDLAINFALDHIASLNGLPPWDNNCANLVSRALSAGGVIDPSGLWDPTDANNLPAVRAGNASEYDLFDFLSNYFKVEKFSIQPGIKLRGNSSWETWFSALSNRVRKGDVVFYTWDDGVIHDYWDHVAIVASVNQPETTLFNGNSSNLKPKVVEQSGSLNNFCWPNQNAPDPSQYPECSTGVNATNAGRSIDDTMNRIASLAIIFMQEPR